MSDTFGFEVFDTSGTVLTTTTDRLLTLVGIYSYNYISGTTSVPFTVSVSGISADGDYFVVGNSGLASFVVGTNEVIIYPWVGSSFSDTFSVFQM